MINSIKEDKELLMFIDADMRDLGITNYPRESVIEAVRNGAGSITVEGQQEFSEYDRLQCVDYSIALKQYITPNHYQPIALFARISDEPGKMQLFKLTGEGYFTLPQAVNLLNGRPVAKKELVDKRIQESWFILEPGGKDIYGNSRLVKTPLSSESLAASIDQFPIKDLVGSKQELISSLKKGDLAPVTLLKAGIETIAFAMAAPNNVVNIVTGGKQKSKQSQLSSQRKPRGI